METLTQIVLTVKNTANAGVQTLLPMALHTLSLVALIDFSLGHLKGVLSEDNHVKLLVEQILKYGFYGWIIRDYIDLTDQIAKSFIGYGLAAGGGGLSIEQFVNPSQIIDTGYQAIYPAIDLYLNAPLLVFSSPLYILVLVLLIMLCYLTVAFQTAFSFILFFLVKIVAIVLLPFGAFKHLRFLAEKAIGAIFTSGIRLMALAFITSFIMPMIKAWTLPQEPNFQDCMTLLAGIGFLALMSWKAPDIASGLMAGAPSLSLKDATTTATKVLNKVS